MKSRLFSTEKIKPIHLTRYSTFQDVLKTGLLDGLSATKNKRFMQEQSQCQVVYLDLSDLFPANLEELKKTLYLKTAELCKQFSYVNKIPFVHGYCSSELLEYLNKVINKDLSVLKDDSVAPLWALRNLLFRICLFNEDVLPLEGTDYDCCADPAYNPVLVINGFDAFLSRPCKDKQACTDYMKHFFEKVLKNKNDRSEFSAAYIVGGQSNDSNLLPDCEDRFNDIGGVVYSQYCKGFLDNDAVIKYAGLSFMHHCNAAIHKDKKVKRGRLFFLHNNDFAIPTDFKPDKYQMRIESEWESFSLKLK